MVKINTFFLSVCLDILEKTDKRGLRFVTNKNTSDYEENFELDKKLNICKKWLKTAAITMYKVKMGRAPRYIEELFLTQELPYDMRDNDRYLLPNYSAVTFGRKSFRYFGA